MKKFAAIFPGQGSQTIGMLAALAEKHSIIETTFLQASEVLNYNLWHQVQHGTTAELNQTVITQPALLTASVAIWQLFRQQGAHLPTIAAGHSLGEYSALVCADAINFIDAVKLVALRGKLMQQAVPKTGGAMFAIIGLEKEKIISICKETEQSQEGVVEAVNDNAPNQIIISGNLMTVEYAAQKCREFGAKKVIKLPISIPAHSALMQGAAKKFRQAIKDISILRPAFPCINNVDVEAEMDPGLIRENLIRQIYSPVRWRETIQHIQSVSVNCLLEIGPNNVLTNLTKRIFNSRDIHSISVNNIESLTLSLQLIQDR